MRQVEDPPASVLLAGDARQCAGWQQDLERTCRPATRIFNVAGIELPPELAKGRAPAQGAAGWVCRGTHCLPPVSSFSELAALLG
jgi:hypothetical protein